MKFFALALALLLSPSLASADDMSLEMWLSWYDRIDVGDPHDQVSDDCWSSPVGTNAVVEKELTSLSVPLKSEAGSAEAIIRVSSLGFSTGKQGAGECAVHYRIAIFGIGGPEGSLSVPAETYGNWGGLYVAPKDKSQATMDEGVKGYATQIAVAWVKSRKIRAERDKQLAEIDTRIQTAVRSVPTECREPTRKLMLLKGVRVLFMRATSTLPSEIPAEVLAD